MLVLVIGGTGYLYGGLIGAVVFKMLQEVFSTITPQYWQFWIGLVLVVIVLVGRARMHRWALWLPNLVIRQFAGRKAVVPLAKWSMLLTGNYRCITLHEPQSIRDAVHDDLKLSQTIYDHVDAIARRLGADPKDQVPFQKYAKVAEAFSSPRQRLARLPVERPSLSGSTCW